MKHEEDDELKYGNYHYKLSIQAPSNYGKATVSTSINKKTVFLIAPFRFKLTNFTKNKTENEGFCSPPFYTSRGGYKMCVEVYANGNGDGRGTHVSVFARLMKGDNDDYLTWPFTGTVTFELLDQLESKNHHKMIARFVEKSIIKRIENDELALAGGIPKYISHTKLENSQYLKNDMLIFRFSVQVHHCLAKYNYNLVFTDCIIKPKVCQALQFSTELSFIKPVEVLQVSSKGTRYCDDSLGLIH